MFRGALKVFPFPWCTLSRPSTALHRCREYAVPLLANTSIRRAREWFSSWPGLPRFFEGRRGGTGKSYSIPERRLEPNREGEKGIPQTEEQGGGEENEGKVSERDQRVVHAVRGIMSGKYVVRFYENLPMPNRNSSLSRFFISSDKNRIYD